LSEAAPTIENGEPEVVATVGSRARLACDAFGLPRPEVTWSKNGIELETGSGSRRTVRGTGSLQISMVTLADGGLYECVASNDVGTANRQVRLNVQGTPI